MSSRLEEPRGVEQREKLGFASEERIGDKLSASEAEDVAVAGVAGRDPDSAGVARHRANERQCVLS
jgi:hypothetical protein